MLDVDGVLVDGRPCDGRRWDSDLLEDLGLSPAVLFENFFTAEWNDIVVGKRELLPTLETVLKRLAPIVQAKDLVAYWFEMDSRIIQAVLSDVRIARGQGIPVHLATNQEHMRVEYLMQTMGLRDEVDGIIYSAKARCKKPSSEFFAFAEQTTGYRPDDLLLVDDTLTNVEAARASGWSAVHWDGTKKLSAILQRSIG
ncbi:HAD-IA family hydrolase [Alisedimentitalea sp. MJ-SS2]|uniref:HAD family hydrolase n=1 Tax=Aliisedimentitalea sp. MJ-SS2 TaxID=3049795 RepID=UPI0029060B14|nr:HAD-IA family hydrolase [Alisedimentitalea sp. MJ-SS2]MDU8928090.1 HAD-IA family hydrolase [Alisedimentitalea sp. MJ-SS2]